MKEIEKLRPSEFARRMGVHPSRITALKDKLNKMYVGNTWFIYLDEQNTRLFENPHKLRGHDINK